MSGGDTAAALLLYARRVSAQPPAPLPTRLPVPAPASRVTPAAPQPAKSLDELKAMQRDPRYARPDQRDPAFVQQVDAAWRAAFPGSLPASHVGGHTR